MTDLCPRSWRRFPLLWVQFPRSYEARNRSEITEKGEVSSALNAVKLSLAARIRMQADPCDDRSLSEACGACVNLVYLTLQRYYLSTVYSLCPQLIVTMSIHLFLDVLVPCSMFILTLILRPIFCPLVVYVDL